MLSLVIVAKAGGFGELASLRTVTKNSLDDRRRKCAAGAWAKKRNAPESAGRMDFSRRSNKGRIHSAKCGISARNAQASDSVPLSDSVALMDPVVLND